MFNSKLNRKILLYLGIFTGISILIISVGTYVFYLPDNPEKSAKDIIPFLSIVNILIIVNLFGFWLLLTRSFITPLRDLRDQTDRLLKNPKILFDNSCSNELEDLKVNINKLSGQAEKSYHNIEVVTKITSELSKAGHPETLITNSLVHICSFTGSTAGTIFRQKQGTGSFSIVCKYGLSQDQADFCRSETAIDLVLKCAEKKEHVQSAITNTDYKLIPELTEKIPGYLVALPVVSGDNVDGVLLLLSDKEVDSGKVKFLDGIMGIFSLLFSTSGYRNRIDAMSDDLKSVNDELQKMKEEVDKAEGIRSEFLTSVSHELRTPLNSLIGYSSVLLNPDSEPLSTEQEQIVIKILKSGKHLLRLINDILDLSKIKAGKMYPTIKIDSAYNIVTKAILVVEPMIDNTDLNLKKVIAPNLPILKTDTLKISQILINLLGNAIKSSEQGEIVVRVYQKGDKLCFEVSDQGTGIAEENLEIIFEEFRQVNLANSSKNESTGLGLPISRRLAHLLGGELQVSSTPGKGSTFTLTIPPSLDHQSLGIQDPQTGEYIRDTLNLIADSKKQLRDEKRLSILCVDDDPDAIDILKKYLEPLGYSVTGAQSGREGLKRARELQPSLITLDILMPDIDGWQVLRELKQYPETRNIPVIIHSIVDNQPRALSLGAVRIMSKPIDPDELMSLIQLTCIEKDHYVLLVDDNREFVSLLKKLIENEGYLVKVAENGIRALELINEARPAILFLDLVMPEMDGFALIHELKDHDAFRNIPIVILSGKSLTNEEKDYLDNNIQYYMRKEEFSHETILDSIKRILHFETNTELGH